MALSLNSQLESKINEMKNIEITKEIIKEILSEANAILKCFTKSIELSATSTTVRIESANFAYTLLSYCGRLMMEDNVENLSIGPDSHLHFVSNEFIARWRLECLKF